MARIRKVGHVVLGVRDTQVAAQFYTEALGMEVVNTLDLDGMQMTFLSFGERDHDIAVLQVPEDHPVGSPGFSHTALEIEGGEDHLKALYHRVKEYGATVELTADHVITKSFYCLDPDGNRLELFIQVLEQEEAKQVLHDAQSAAELMQPLTLGAP
jgi:catechol-2,3-dioxygenase